ncbi:MAG TPA: hypothetical protein VL625_03875 [Patescibacteria group bacterium]|nr:hypothetical protein [Patescibacteria group bacterium]
MDDLVSLVKQVEHLAINDYKAGVREALPKDVKPVYINPNELKNPDMAKNVAHLRKSLEKQMPGITGKPGDPDYLSDADLAEMVALSTTRGPFEINANFNGQKIAIVNTQDKSLDNKNKIMPVIAHIPRDQLKPPPGPDWMWDKAIGIHEGTHAKQADVDPNLPAPEQLRLTIQREAESDRAAIEFLRKQGREDMAQTLIDARALGAAEDPTHATGLMIAQNGPINVTPAQADAAGKFKAEMDQGVANKLGITVDQAKDLQKKDPRKYIDTVDGLLKDNAIGSTPEVKQFMEQYAGAYRREVVDKNVKPGQNKKAEAANDTEAPTEPTQTQLAQTLPTLTQYYRTDSTVRYGGTLVAGDNTLGASVRGDADNGRFRLTGAWNAAREADKNAVPGLIPPTSTPPVSSAPTENVAYKNNSAPAV